MKAILSLATVVAISASSLAGVALAQTTSPEDCVAEIGKLDTDGDGFVMNNEASAYGEIGTNIDVDNDGRLSVEERTVACQNGLIQSMRSKGTSG
ncbi:MAG: hypothetical protein R3D57_12460 [Hyphomicrobiaceae bacterium]